MAELGNTDTFGSHQQYQYPLVLKYFQYFSILQYFASSIVRSKFDTEVLFFSVSYGRKKYWSIQFFQYYQNTENFGFSVFLSTGKKISVYWKEWILQYFFLPYDTEKKNTSVSNFFSILWQIKILKYHFLPCNTGKNRYLSIFFSVSYGGQKYWSIFILSIERILRFYFYQYLKILKNFKSSIYQ